jgi:hypothetical protein
MNAKWVGGSVRARLLLERRLGWERAQDVAGASSLRSALELLAEDGYCRDVPPGVSLAAAQRSIAAAALFRLRILAGWLPPEGVGILRALAAWFELANVEDRLAYLHGGGLEAPFELGALASAWRRIEATQTPAELRAALAGSVWGDPGGEEPETVHLGLRLSWARRVLASAPEAVPLVAGALALLLARELFAAGRTPELITPQPFPAVGSKWQAAGTLGDLASALPDTAAWVLAGVDSAEQLWEAETAWWTRVAEEGGRLVQSFGSRSVVIGAAALFAVDAWRACAALEIARLGGPLDLRERFGGRA